MATIRDHTTHVLELEMKLRFAGGTKFADEHFTIDGFEARVTDPQTGQVALLTLSPINEGICPGCGHVNHQELTSCAALLTISKTPCRCPGAWREDLERIEATA